MAATVKLDGSSNSSPQKLHLENNKLTKAATEALQTLNKISTSATGRPFEVTSWGLYAGALGFGIAGFFMPILWVAALGLFLTGLIVQFTGVGLEQRLSEENQKLKEKNLSSNVLNEIRSVIEAPASIIFTSQEQRDKMNEILDQLIQVENSKDDMKSDVQRPPFLNIYV